MKTFFKEQLPTFQPQFLPLSDEPQQSTCAILGVGENGHIAFHEPEISLSLYYGCVSLSESTKESLKLSCDSMGLTYGLDYFLKVKHVLILASGIKKKSVINSLLKEENSPFLCQN